MKDGGIELDIVLFETAMNFIKRHSVVIATVGLTGLGFLGLRRYFGGGVFRGNASLEGKTAIVTGSNIGIGKETAKELARRGARVILACRDITRAERAAADIRHVTGNRDVHVRVVDLSSLESVRRFCDTINAGEKEVNLLINNAGVMACPHWTSEEGYELQFAVNHLGHFLLTNLLLDKLKDSAPSRVINVSSIAHRKGRIDLDDINFEKREYEPFKAYGQSKLANVLFTRELNKRLKGSGVTTYSLHPGVVLTELSRNLSAIEVPAWKLFAFKWLVGPIFLKTPWQGAQTTLYCALQEGLEKDSGKYFSDCALKEVEAHARDDVMAARLWALSEDMVEKKAK